MRQSSPSLWKTLSTNLCRIVLLGWYQQLVSFEQSTLVKLKNRTWYQLTAQLQAALGFAQVQRFISRKELFTKPSNIKFVDVSENRNERKENGKRVDFSASLNLNDTCQPAIEFSIRILVLLSVKYVNKPLSSRRREINYIITYYVYISVIRPWIKMMPVNWYDIFSLREMISYQSKGLNCPIK